MSLTRDKLLANPRRAMTYNFIVANPGANFREVVRCSGLASGTVRHHLSVLARHGLVVERRHRSTVRYFENHGRFATAWEPLVLLRQPELRALHEWIAVCPLAHQKAVLAAMQESHGWSRSTTQHRLGRLAAGGAVQVVLRGRRKEYRALPLEARPLVVPAVPSAAPAVSAAQASA